MNRYSICCRLELPRAHRLGIILRGTIYFYECYFVLGAILLHLGDLLIQSLRLSFKLAKVLLLDVYRLLQGLFVDCALPRGDRHPIIRENAIPGG